MARQHESQQGGDGIVRAEGADPEMTRLFTDEGDIRNDPEIGG
ncbi:MAG TPA: hypothetical protein VKE70_10640 [Candidatus Solibacter sp.]|nr:hypothetical protein [Candidatus Solibacter sp.]